MAKLGSIPHPGLRAKNTRRRLGLTLDQVSAQSELSKGHLSRFERGEKTLSVAALIRLSSALEVSVGSLLGEEISHEEIRLVRASDMPSLEPSKKDRDHPFYTLSGNFDGQTHSTFIVDVPINKPHTSNAFHGGYELLFVVEGEIQMSIGKEDLNLAKGDYLEFPGNISHTIESLSATSRILLTIVDA